MKEILKNDAIWARFYRDGKSVGEICEEFGCGIYDLSPWLMAPLARTAMDTSQAYANKVHDLKEALRPFAFENATLDFDRFDDGNTAWVAVDGAGSSRVYFFVGDVSRARKALSHPFTHKDPHHDQQE